MGLDIAVIVVMRHPDRSFGLDQVLARLVVTKIVASHGPDRPVHGSGTRRGRPDLDDAAALGYATLGQIGFDQRLEYTAIGSVVSLAHRLGAAAESGQALISQRVLGAIEPLCEVTPIGELVLKGFQRPVPAYDLVRWRDEEHAAPAAGA
jgi:class 3 adenylate cyclase